MSKRFKIITLGCKVNQYESAYFKDALSSAGWRQADNGEYADVAVVNTCIVTQKAAHQSRQAVRKAIRDNPEGFIAAVGCYAQVFPEELSAINGIDLIANNAVKGALPNLLADPAGLGERIVQSEGFHSDTLFECMEMKHFPDRSRAYLKIQDGCESFCSYCLVPRARGPYRSLHPSKVLSMLESMADGGYKEVVLTGIHLGKYGVDLVGQVDLCRLLKALGKENFPVRIRLSSLEPNEIPHELVEMMASEAWFCRHFHVPMQSGDNEILRKMGRHYTAKEFMTLIQDIYETVPSAAIGLDVMAGFPGECNAAHENTRSLIEDLPVSYLHVFPYSPRPGTPAHNFDGRLAPEVIGRRAAKLRDLGKRKRTEFHERCLGKTFEVLVENWLSEATAKGTSDNDLRILFPYPKDIRGQILPVRLEKMVNGVLTGFASE